jgi:hypothetical protein
MTPSEYYSLKLKKDGKIFTGKENTVSLEFSKFIENKKKDVKKPITLLNKYFENNNDSNKIFLPYA